MRKALCKTILTTLAGVTCSASFACTLFAAAPDRTEDGSVLVAKVRDWTVDEQEVRTGTSANGTRIWGIYNGKRKRMNSGMNEHGLVVIKSQAGSISKEKLESSRSYRYPGNASTYAEYLLANAKTVEEALSLPKTEASPQNLLLADAGMIATVEVLPDGTKKIVKSTTGTMAHTNHYVLDGAGSFNDKVGKSSRVRFGRINDLLSGRAKFTFDDFVAFANDRNAGPVNSIFRTGKSVYGHRTTAILVMSLAKDRAPVIYSSYIPDGNAHADFVSAGPMQFE